MAVEKSDFTRETTPCRAIVRCQTPEPFYLLYLRERWHEKHGTLPHTLQSEDSDSSREEEVNPLLLNPVEWKDQDHYIILGLGKLRYKATPQDIRKAYRNKVLAHHPDKQTEVQQRDGDDHFKCIQIAYDILWDAKKRRAYDSVDPTFDDSIPSICTASREHFFATFGPVFSENSRFSTRQPVPQLGDANSAISEVESFYSFWYNFESWREFSYLDEENPEKGECREERRWIEKQNKAVRQKKKKEDTARIRTLVDNAYACDPRVKKFKEEEKTQKEAKRKAKVEAAKKEAAQREEEERRKLEEIKLQQLKEEEEAKAQAAQAKKEKETAKKLLRKERKALRTACKEHNYFARNDSELVSRMQDLDRLCTSLSAEMLQQLNEQLSKTTTVEEAEALFENQVSELNKREHGKLNESQKPTAVVSKTAASSLSSTTSDSWSMEEVQLLVKAVNMFPAGTVKRWETIANFINTHSTTSEHEPCKEKDSKMVISKVKSLHKLESEQKEALNKQAFARFEQQHQPQDKGRGKGVEQPQATPSVRYDALRPWTAEEQKLLEQALRSNPASLGTQRWDRISAVVGTRTRDECVARFKELVARVKAKKQHTTS